MTNNFKAFITTITRLLLSSAIVGASRQKTKVWLCIVQAKASVSYSSQGYEAVHDTEALYYSRRKACCCRHATLGKVMELFLLTEPSTPSFFPATSPTLRLQDAHTGHTS